MRLVAALRGVAMRPAFPAEGAARSRIRIAIYRGRGFERAGLKACQAVGEVTVELVRSRRFGRNAYHPVRWLRFQEERVGTRGVSDRSVGVLVPVGVPS
jgi:hypothetical protein